MNFVLPRKVVLLFLLSTGLLQSSCLSRKTIVPAGQRLLPAQTATRADLLKKLENQSQAVKTITATTLLDVSRGGLTTAVLTEYHQTKTYVIVDRPNHIRLKAVAPLGLGSVFDMVSDGKQYRAYIPLQAKFYVGDSDAPPKSTNPLENLRPQHILNALFIEIRDYLNKPEIRNTIEQAVEGRNSYYVVDFIDTSGVDAQLLEKIWIDRFNMEISRKQIFGKDGTLETDVQYSKYSMHDGVLLPEVIAIQRPIEDYSLKMTFESMTVNQPLAADAFQLDRPDGTALVQLGQ